MALRPAPKRKVDYQKLDDLQKEIFGSEQEGSEGRIELQTQALTVHSNYGRECFLTVMVSVDCRL